MVQLQVRLLGPLDVLVDGAVRPVAGLRRQAVLATLALRAGEIVGTDRLIEVVWDGDAPATAANVLQSHVSYLRRVLGSKDVIVSRSPGYVFTPGPDATDVAVAERLVRLGLDAPERTQAAAHLRAALDLWRARPLIDLSGLSWLDEQADRLAEVRLSALQALINTRLALGEHTELVPELETLVREHPFRERIHGQLMVALYRSGRQADALAAYQRLRQFLADELGVDPCQELRDLEVAILRQDGALAAPSVQATEAAARADATGSVPGQLPLAVRGFAGRTDELATLDNVLARGPDSGYAVVLIMGSAGVGKTSLAVHWAHRAATCFPDGQLYVNLRGFDPGGSVMSPAEALRRFLDALGVPPERIPLSQEAQAALFRSVLTGRRMLVVLDNARDADQVRPLLPGSAGCLVLVTSRNRLVPLVVTEGAEALHVDLMPASEARDLLARRLGADRVAAEPAVIDDIIARCDRLPLALAIASGRAATEPALALSDLAGELAETSSRLDVLDAGDAKTDVRVVFSSSYRALAPETARFFRLLGLHLGPGTSVPAAASLTGIPVSRARRLIAELCHAHLLVEHRSGRYVLHDLLCLYANEQNARLDAGEDRDAAVHRLLDYYLHTAHSAAVLVNPNRAPITLIPPAEHAHVEQLATADAARAWYTSEHLALFAAIERAPTRFDAHRWRLLWSVMPYVSWRGRWPAPAVLQACLDAACRLGDGRGEVEMVRCLAIADSRSGRNDQAEVHLKRALRLYENAGDLVGQARGHADLSSTVERLGRLKEALWHSEQSLELYRAAGHRVGEAKALNSVGWMRLQSGEHEEALPLLQKALAMHQELGDLHGGSITRDSIGYAHCQLGEYRQAIVEYQRAIAGFREFGDVYNEAETLTRLGDAHRDADDLVAARQSWEQALAIFDDLAHPAAEELRARLRLRAS